MIRLLLAILPFLKEVIFGRDRQDRHKPPIGRFKKLVIYTVIVGSFSLNYFLVKRAVGMAIQIRDAGVKLEQLDAVKDKLAIQEAISEKLAAILGDKVRAELLTKEAEMLTKEAAVLDKEKQLEREKNVSTQPATHRPTRVRPNIAPAWPMAPGARYEFRGQATKKLSEKYTRDE